MRDYSVFLARTHDCHVQQGCQKVTFTTGTHPSDLHSLHGRTLFADLTPIFHDRAAELSQRRREGVKIKTITFLFRYFYFLCIVNCALYSCTRQTRSFKALRIRESQGYTSIVPISLRDCTIEIVSRAKRCSVSPRMNLISHLSKSMSGCERQQRLNTSLTHPLRTRNLHATIPILSLLAIGLSRIIEGNVAINSLYIFASSLFLFNLPAKYPRGISNHLDV